MLYTERYAVEGPKLSNFSFPEDRALLVVGDSHGQADALRGLLDGLGRMVTPGKKRTLVFLGDFVDRGPDSLGCLLVALNEGADRANADEVVYLPGNHELLLADTIEDAMTGGKAALGNRSAGECWMRNGGMNFMMEVFGDELAGMPKDPAEGVLAFAEKLPHPGFASFAEMVRSWPSHFRMGDALCVHAGLYPTKPHDFTLGLDQRSHFPTSPFDRGGHDRHWAWIRDDFLGWQGGWPETGAKDDDHGVLVLHGHTVPHGARASKLEHGDDVRKVFCRMATNARICVDGGAARGVGVAGTVLTANGVRVLFNPV